MELNFTGKTTEVKRPGHKHAYNPSTWETETGDCKFEDNLGYIVRLKTNKHIIYWEILTGVSLTAGKQMELELIVLSEIS
jgi:hypothetical protein